jgi:hypothetical protein
MEEMINVCKILFRELERRKFFWGPGHSLKGNIEMHTKGIFNRTGCSRLRIMFSNDGCSLKL